jgi:hypothetical protein
VQTDKRQQLLVVAAIAGIVLFAGDKLLLTPLTAAWKARNAHIHELQTQLAQGKTLLDREARLRSSWEQIRRSSLPRSTSAAEQQFFRAIDQWAQDSRIGITAITPQWKTDSKEYMTLQCRVDAAGNIGALSRFVYNIERDAMALKIESVELGSRDKEGQALSMGLQVSALVLTPTNK